MSLEIDAAAHSYVYGKKKIRAGISESQQLGDAELQK